MLDLGTDPRRYAWLSVGAALLTMALKFWAWHLTDSVGLLSDALESIVNLGAAAMAVWLLTIAALPPDAEHAYGHGKAEYFASAFEGLLIAVAAVSIVYAAVPRLFNPRALEQVGLGLVISTAASLLNGMVAFTLMRAGKRLRSVTLTADAHHLYTDVWTSVGVIAAVGLVAITGWTILDPLIAIAVAINILWTGWRLLGESVQGLMDVGWPAEERATLDEILAEFRTQGAEFHALRTRRAGARRFVFMHMLVPGAWTVQQAHDLAERVEDRITERLAPVTVETHLEPIEDPAAHGDEALDHRIR